jgi:hypothetical protein
MNNHSIFQHQSNQFHNIWVTLQIKLPLSQGFSNFFAHDLHNLAILRTSWDHLWYKISYNIVLSWALGWGKFLFWNWTTFFEICEKIKNNKIYEIFVTLLTISPWSNLTAKWKNKELQIIPLFIHLYHLNKLCN